MNRLKELRVVKGFTIRSLSQKVGVSHTQITHIENGKRNLTAKNAALFAEFFGVSIDYLLGADAEAMLADFVSSIRRDLFATQLDSFSGAVQGLPCSIPEPLGSKLHIILILEKLKSAEAVAAVLATAKLWAAKEDFGGDL